MFRFRAGVTAAAILVAIPALAQESALPIPNPRFEVSFGYQGRVPIGSATSDTQGSFGGSFGWVSRGPSVALVVLSDTIGAATPGDVLRVLEVGSKKVPLHQIALHFHDTRGTALANVLAGLDYGVTTFDSSAGGLGGCPFAPGAAGNLATEDLLFLLNGLGIETGVSIDRVADASRFIETKLDHKLPSRYLQAPRLSR